MQTEIDGKISKYKPIVLGVPLLFLIYVNFFRKCLTSGKAIKFAGDTNLFFNSNSYQALH